MMKVSIPVLKDTKKMKLYCFSWFLFGFFQQSLTRKKTITTPINLKSNLSSDSDFRKTKKTSLDLIPIPSKLRKRFRFRIDPKT